ncbi:MAG TPA: NAD(P)/FAD-dependent oxidoreductase [Quisquiliibacterium sp.]|nr:NAD(P)/FAD-dependent oxidoreductase [Quisquiliibacterium sp.]
MNASAHANELDAVIIGAGFAGMYQLLRLRDTLGLRARVLEAGGGVGGTWYWNRYPGARCDSESHSYMYYFSKELVQEWEWTERYPQQPEILRYLNHVADRFDLRRDIQLNARVSEARYDEADDRWHVRTEGGETFVARYLITAVGCLSAANIPKIPGLEDFHGQWYHTGQWPHEGVDFSGKRVGVIGTGSTGIQAIPVIAAQAAHLTVFQRTANYSIPARNAPLTAEFKAYAKARADDIRYVMNTNANGHPFRVADRSALAVPEAERKALYEAAWQKGGLEFRAVFRDLLQDKSANDTAAEFIREKIRSIVRDPEKARILSDIDHPFASKRPPVDSNYFEAFNSDHVSLVDLRATPIERITPTGIRTSAGEHELDIIVFATGFDAMTGSLLKIDIRGRGGRSLREDWRAGPRTYLGLQVPGYPNLFTITGPGSPSVLCNLPPHIEQHVDWITACIRHLREHGVARIEPAEEAADAWQREVDAAAKATLLADVKHSWYLGANVPGKPRVFMPYAGGFGRYRDKCEEVARTGYAGFRLER